MPTRRRPASLLAIACLVAVTVIGVAPAPASALEPPRPLPGHRPVFVTETDVRPWDDCLWASAAMLLDKWTNGDRQLSHQRLRQLSGDLAGGSSLEDLRVAFGRLGFAVPLDANGDSTLTWGGLLARLKDGAGAVVLGDYGSLPRWYGRWDYRFWRGRGRTGTDDHAIYVERYDARRGRVWIMDPLGRNGYRGEWLSIWSLYRFAWFSGGRVQAVVTPTAKPAPFAGVELADPELGLSSRAITATWAVDAPRRWRFPGAAVRLAVTRAADPLATAAAAATLVVTRTHDPAPPRPLARVAGQTLRVSAALPEAPGAYTVAMTLTDRRFGRRVAATPPVAVFVPGPRRATVRLHGVDAEQVAGTTVRVAVTVTNSGRMGWGDARAVGDDDDAPASPTRATRLVATWIPLADDGTPADPEADHRGPVTLDLRPVALKPGASAKVRVEVSTPDAAGRWALVIDVVDDVDGSFAAAGSAPAVGRFSVRSGDAVDPADRPVD